MGGRLIVCPTPIGNLGDVSRRVADALREADSIACEDTRVTRVLLSALGIPAPRLVALHEHNEAEAAERLCAAIGAGSVIVLTTDAGMPAISDPGRTLIARVRAADHPIDVLPGPSAVETALVTSGLAAEGYAFGGFAPQRRASLDRLLARLDGTGLPVVLFESPRRLPGLLRHLANRDADRPAAVCRELTKLHEEVARGTLSELAARFDTAPRGEITLVLAAVTPLASHAATDALAAGITRLRASGLPTREAAEIAAALTGMPRRVAYDALLADHR